MANTIVVNSRETDCEVDEYEIHFECPRLSGTYFFTLIGKEGVYEIIATDENEKESHYIRRFHRFDDKRLGKAFTKQDCLEYLAGVQVIEDIVEYFNLNNYEGRLW